MHADPPPTIADRAGAPAGADARLSDADFALLCSPPRVTAALPGIGGRMRCRPEDFVVHEIPAYGPDGREGAHLLLTLRKRRLTTEEAVEEVARACQIPRIEIGVAGLKDREAITEQQISAPWSAREALAAFRHPAIELGPAAPHSHKLRRGHLKGNRFEVTIRDLVVDVDAALARVQAKLDALAAAGGLDNLYGGQRFGDGGRNIARGLRYLAGEGARMRRKADFLVSAGQSTLFNLYLLERRARGLSRTVLAGDILRKTTSGGLFECADPAVDQARLDAGEVEITGPIYGGKMMAPSEGTPSADLEAAILARTGVTQTALNALGRKVPGTRRPLQLTPTDLQIRAAPAVELASRAPGPHNPSLLSEGVCLSFGLPAGAYATQLTHEIQGPTDLETP
ncbi:MAG: tRNA pseudouridine(13) synthase TruD [Myxococcales bacterium]|nr:tRNA pseudouridine(13) synthase TruD [Myxococcales bacterium]MCB9700704.1 tRNA pseudouridine(13) synthase TruD [Myxococcales bacterium]